MKTIFGLGIVVIASIALLQPAQGRPAGGRSAGGGHSFSAGHHYSGAGRYGGYSGGSRYYARGQYYNRGSGSRSAYQAALRNRGYYSSRTGSGATTANRTTALNPRSSSISNRRAVATQQSKLRSLGVDNQGRLPAQATRNWSHGQDHFWHGHRCYWHNNAWVVADFWPWYSPWDYYPWAYGYYGPGYYDPGYYQDEYEPAAYSQQGNGGGAVREVQSVLAEKGYYHGAIDGVMGAETRSAVRQYQRNHGMEVTGNIDQGVIDTLHRR